MTLHTRAAAQAFLVIQKRLQKQHKAKTKPRKLTRSLCRGKFRCRCNSVLGDPKQSEWWIFLLHTDTWDPSSKRGKLFRRRFRVPRALFELFVNMWKDPDRNLQGLTRSDGCGALGR